ncbi:MAG: T9SS type A sorting domain-containing protein [Bacteroidota bacterium]|nr:T9SS type A sorting domain-containing protein [Bacteroidota bacterium]MEC7876496.1 T9SS type A sorting domain-containing protein [Bacteroidota bacterium]
MRYFIILALSVLSFNFLSSQEVLSSAGSFEKSEDLSIDYSIGQTFFQSKKFGPFNYKEGVFQVFKVGLFDNYIEFITKAYPNPNKGVFYISMDAGFTDLDLVSYNIISQSGMLIQEGVMKQNPSRIDISSLSSGVYFVRLSAHGISKTIKIIKD